MSIFETIQTNFEGISPVVGVILMVAITVGLAAVIGVTVFGLGDQVSENTGTIGLSSEQDGVNYTITANSGQFDSFDYVYVTSTSSVSYTGGITGETYPTGPDNSSQYLYNGDSGGTGSSVTIDTSTASDSGQIQVIGVANDNRRVLKSYEFTYSGEQSINTSVAPENLQETLLNMNGNGTETNPYEISNVYELQAVQEDLDAQYRVINDIDASDTSGWENSVGEQVGFSPIGNRSASFTGSIDGQGYEISELTINRPNEDFIGLISVTDSGATLETIQFQDSVIRGGSLVGNLVGSISGETTIHSVRVDSGTVSLNGFLGGGLVGRTNSQTQIRNVRINSTVNGADQTGGIVGRATAQQMTIKNSTYIGDITGEANSGGIVGTLSGSDGVIENVHSSGSVSATQANAGGLIGTMDGKHILQDSTVNVTVIGGNTIGGVVGVVDDDIDGNSPILKNISTQSTVDGTANVGGFSGNIRGTNTTVNQISVQTETVSGGNLVGGFSANINGNISIENVSATVDSLSGSARVGGFSGDITGDSIYNENSEAKIDNVFVQSNITAEVNAASFASDISYAIVKNSYATGTLDVENENAVSGFADSVDDETLIDTYWNTDTTGITTTAGNSTGLTTSEMTGDAAPSNMTGFDFVTVWETTEQYPKLQWET